MFGGLCNDGNSSLPSANNDRYDYWYNEDGNNYEEEHYGKKHNRSKDRHNHQEARNYHSSRNWRT